MWRLLEVLVVLLVMAVPAVAAQDVYEPCPHRPDSAAVTPAAVMADGRWKAALLEVDALLQNATERGETLSGNFSGLPGLVVTVTLGQKQAWVSSYGLRDARDKTSGKPTPNDLVWIASITKTFTSTLLHILRDEGVVALEDPVSKYFPDFRYKSPWPSAKPMTLGQLASHTSGLPRETPFYVCDREPACKTNSTERERRILAAIADQWLVVKPGTRFHYSNLGFALLGRALGHAASASYESLVAQKILKPLGMDSATFESPASLAGVAIGFRPTGAVGIQSHSDAWGAPAGDLLVSTNDMAKWMALWARRDQPRFATNASAAQILDGATLDEMLQPVVEMRDGRAAIGKPPSASRGSFSTRTGCGSSPRGGPCSKGETLAIAHRSR